MADDFGLKIGVEGEMLVKDLAGSIDDNGDKAVKAAENMSSDISDVMNILSDDMKTALPNDFKLTEI